MSKETKILILEMSVGIILYNVILMCLSFFVCPRFGYSAVPVASGFVIAAIADIIMLIHMGYVTEASAGSKDEAYANRITLIHASARKVIFVVFIVLLWLWFHISMLAVVIGAMGLKAGALLQPSVHKIMTKCLNNRNH